VDFGRRWRLLDGLRFVFDCMHQVGRLGAFPLRAEIDERLDDRRRRSRLLFGSQAPKGAVERDNAARFEHLEIAPQVALLKPSLGNDLPNGHRPRSERVERFLLRRTVGVLPVRWRPFCVSRLEPSHRSQRQRERFETVIAHEVVPLLRVLVLLRVGALPEAFVDHHGALDHRGRDGRALRLAVDAIAQAPLQSARSIATMNVASVIESRPARP
jgi:hypothetical protein